MYLLYVAYINLTLTQVVNLMSSNQCYINKDGIIALTSYEEIVFINVINSKK